MLPVRRSSLAVLMAAGVLLGLVSAVLQLAKHSGFEPSSLQLDRLFSVDEDLSVMNWLSASTFLLAALAAIAAAAQAQDRRAGRLGWLALAGALAFVSLDEAAQVHDPAQELAKDQLRAGGLRAVLVLVAGAALGAVAARFVLRLPPPVRWRVGGSLGLLLLAAVAIDSAGRNLVEDPAARLEAGYVARSTLEEVIELGSAVLVLDGMVVASLRR